MSAPAYEIQETLLKIEHVSHSYGGRPVLKDLNAEVKNVHRPGLQQGQIVALLGPSGVGKTTLFRILAGLMAPDSGTVLIGPDSRPVTRGAVGVVAQDYPLFAHRTVLSNLTLAAQQVGPASDSRQRAEAILERFGLSEQSAKYPAQLSGGQRQRVAIAQQLLCSDLLVLMDEPFSGLDPVAVDNIVHFFGEMALTDEHKTFVIVTHDIDAAVEVADTLWLLGRDRDAANQPIPGARIQRTYDLMAMGLAWRDGIADDPACRSLMAEIRDAFRRL